MTSIQDALTSIGLEKYIDPFLAVGVSYLEDLISLTPQDLEKAFTEIGMLKGHTFKLKKLIEDVKVGVVPKASMPQPVNSIPVKPKPDLPLQSKPEVVKSVEANGKDLLHKLGTVQNQCENILQTRESLVASLKQFLGLNLTPYFEALNQLKTMQETVKEMVEVDVDMTN